VPRGAANLGTVESIEVQMRGVRRDRDFTQPGLLFRLMSPQQQQQTLFDNTARAVGDASEEVKVRHIGNCLKADPARGEGVAAALGIAMSTVVGSLRSAKGEQRAPCPRSERRVRRAPATGRWRAAARNLGAELGVGRRQDAGELGPLVVGQRLRHVV
jgi:hypothetical protein